MELAKGKVIEGVAGTATEVLMVSQPDLPDWTATLAVWFLDCPGQSIAWRHYLLSIIHLRPIEGVKEAVIRIPGATHEVLLVALDSQGNPSPVDHNSWQHLTPVNVQEQITLPSDEMARDFLSRCAWGVVKGYLPAEPPLSGQVEPWRAALIMTAAHYRGEEHASGV